MLRRFGFFTIVLCAACTDSAGPGDGIVCTASVEPAIVVRLVDGATGSEGLPGFPYSDDLTRRRFGWVQDGGYVDSLRASSMNEDTLRSVKAADERPGTYNVLVRFDGYGDWRAFGVVVERGVCHVRTVELRAVLQPD
jgi:hypothetical protein